MLECFDDGVEKVLASAARVPHLQLADVEDRGAAHHVFAVPVAKAVALTTRETWFHPCGRIRNRRCRVAFDLKRWERPLSFSRPRAYDVEKSQFAMTSSRE